MSFPVTRLRAGEACPDGCISIPILPMKRGEAYTVHVARDVPSLALSAGMALEMVAQSHIDCDALYHLADGNFARIQFWTAGKMRLVRDSGVIEFLPKREIDGMVQGYWTGRIAKGNLS